MADKGMASEAYMEAFMNGFEFVLLAMRGRIAEGNVPDDERERLESFLADYWRIARAFHDRREAPAPQGLSVHGRLPVDIAPTMAN